MKSCPSADELSAYLDGESRDKEHISRHIQGCPVCARRHLELCRVSIHLKAIEPPKTDAAFAERVMARIEAESGQPASPWVFPPRLVMAASFLALLGAVVLPWMLQPEQATGGAPALNPDWRNDAEVVAALAELMDAGADVGVFPAWEEDLDYDDEAAVPYDDMVAALAEAVPEDSVEPEVPEDFAAILDALAALDASALDQLLKDYESEG